MVKISSKEKIISASIELFSAGNFDEVTIVEICKLSNISNGAFYKHFKNKDEIFKFLLEKTIIDLDKKLMESSDDSQILKKRLKAFVQANFKNAKELSKLIRIYREGQYKFIEYEKRLREEVYLKHLKKIFKRDLTEFEYVYIMSGIRYLSVYNATHQGNYDSEESVDFMVKLFLKGFFNSSFFSLKNIKFPLNTEKNYQEEDIRKKIIENGAYLFGKKGYYSTGVYEITDMANIATGSFYNYFDSKESFFYSIIKNMILEFSNFLKIHSSNFKYPCENTLWLLYLIKEFFENQSHKYELLRTSEFVDSNLIKNYYNIIEKTFIKTLKNIDYSPYQKDIIAKIFIGITHYMGIEYFFTKNLKDFLLFSKEIEVLMVQGTE